MANYLRIYKNDPTAGLTDGTQASEDGAQTAPITARLVTTSSSGASTAIKLAARCDTGYQTSGATALKFVVNSTGTDYTGDNYKLAADNSYTNAADALVNATWASSLSIATTVGATNTIFWAKLSAPANSVPTNDTTISLYHEETVEAV